MEESPGNIEWFVRPVFRAMECGHAGTNVAPDVVEQRPRLFDTHYPPRFASLNYCGNLLHSLRHSADPIVAPDTVAPQLVARAPCPWSQHPATKPRSGKPRSREAAKTDAKKKYEAPRPPRGKERQAKNFLSLRSLPLGGLGAFDSCFAAAGKPCRVGVLAHRSSSSRKDHGTVVVHSSMFFLSNSFVFLRVLLRALRGPHFLRGFPAYAHSNTQQAIR